MKKGISPLVATVLLVSITIVVAAVVASWANFYVKGKTTDIQKADDIAKLCEGGNLRNEADFNSYSNGKMVIALKNIGNVPVTNFTLVVKDSTGAVTTPTATNADTMLNPTGFLLLEALVATQPKEVLVSTSCSNVQVDVEFV